MLISSPGAATQRTTPPKALNVRHDAVDAKELSLAARYRYVIGQFLERLEDEVDTAERRPASSERQQQTLEARDQRLARWRPGLHMN